MCVAVDSAGNGYVGTAPAPPTPPAAPTATTKPASAVGTQQATLNGSVNTQGQAVSWQFQYGSSKSYNKGTPVQTIAAGRGVVPVSWTLLHLRANTTYHFRLAATYAGSGGAQTTVFGRDLTFTTKTTGALLLRGRRLKVTGRRVSVKFTCKSPIRCVSQYSITAAARIVKGKTGATIVCAVQTVRLKPHQTKVFKHRVAAACLRRLRANKHHRLKAKLTARPRTGQKGLIKRVTLVL
jgi:hypothetical protein